MKFRCPYAFWHTKRCTKGFTAFLGLFGDFCRNPLTVDFIDADTFQKMNQIIKGILIGHSGILNVMGIQLE